MKLPKTLRLKRPKSIRLVEVLARRQIGELLQMLRAQRSGDIVFLGKPFSKINQLATMRTERPVIPRKPFTGFPARRALHLKFRSHGKTASASHFVPDGFEVLDWNLGGFALDACDFQRGLHVRKDCVVLHRGKLLAVGHSFNALRKS